MREQRRLELVVPEDIEEPVRLDHYLTSELSGEFEHLTRSRIQKLISDGQVTVDQKPAKAGLKLRGEEAITVVVPADIRLDVQAENIPLDIVFEDDDLIVVNKPVGMVTHPGAGVHNGTLVNALLYHCGESLSGISGVLRPGIVHRLDKDTSGLLVVAKNDKAHQHLSAQIKEKQARRQYLALLEGVPEPEQGVVDKPLGRHAVDRKKMAIVETGRAARTHYEVLRHWQRFCLIKATLETGRTHQIRVHMASLNCPVVGDTVYNRKATGSQQSRKKLGLQGQALHAAWLSFTHPSSGKPMHFEAPPPPQFQQLMQRLDEGFQP